MKHALTLITALLLAPLEWLNYRGPRQTFVCERANQGNDQEHPRA